MPRGEDQESIGGPSIVLEQIDALAAQFTKDLNLAEGEVWRRYPMLYQARSTLVRDTAATRAPKPAPAAKRTEGQRIYQDEIMPRARGRVSKSVSETEAVAMVLREDPDLYARYSQR